ncbi:MAG: TaqI-like C-terminal specificity domain-containing protein, partial [Dolichospermum sp.]
ILKNVLVGGDFNKYIVYRSEFKVIYTTKSININDYPNILLYLEKYREKLETKRETKKGILPWWCLHWPRYKELFEEDKIIIRQTADRIIATIDNDSYYAMNNVIILKIQKEFQ